MAAMVRGIQCGRVRRGIAKFFFTERITERAGGAICFRHSLNVTTGPIFAQAQDGLGGGDGHFKGVLTTARYTFPLRLPDKEKGERIEIFGHLHGEVFNPGDYYESDRAGWFLRWQVEFKF